MNVIKLVRLRPFLIVNVCTIHGQQYTTQSLQLLVLYKCHPPQDRYYRIKKRMKNSLSLEGVAVLTVGCVDVHCCVFEEP